MSTKIKIRQLDHLVLTVKDIENTVDFYTQILGMKKIIFGDNRLALSFGQQKINLHELGNEFEPKAENVAAGSADLCFILQSSLTDAIKKCQQSGVQILEGPVNRTGAQGSIKSIYIRDPDGNLIELSHYLQD